MIIRLNIKTSPFTFSWKRNSSHDDPSDPSCSCRFLGGSERAHARRCRQSHLLCQASLLLPNEKCLLSD